MLPAKIHAWARVSKRWWRPGLQVALLAALAVPSCVNPLADLPKLFEARRLASGLHVAFTHAADAANRAVMADTDDASMQAMNEAREARQLVERDVQGLQPILQALGYQDELQDLSAFTSRYGEYRRLDDEILPLAVENTNLKAQRLSFGPAQEAAGAFQAALASAIGSRAGKNAQADALAARARVAVLEIQVLQAPHIAEADEAAMTRLEAQMSASAADARTALDGLKRALPPAAAPHLAAADAALARFMKINADLITLSRRNSNVRSLALSLGRKRVVTAECEDQLTMLGQALSKHESTATR